MSEKIIGSQDMDIDNTNDEITPADARKELPVNFEKGDTGASEADSSGCENTVASGDIQYNLIGEIAIDDNVDEDNAAEDTAEDDVALDDNVEEGSIVENNVEDDITIDYCVEEDNTEEDNTEENITEEDNIEASNQVEESAGACTVVNENVEEYDNETVYCEDDDNEYEDYEDDIQDEEKKGTPFLIIFGALMILVVLSFVPWGKITTNFMKDYNLLSDILPREDGDSILESTDMLDPALDEELMALDEGAVVPLLIDSVPLVSGESSDIIQNSPLPPVEKREVPDRPKLKNGMVVLEDYTVDGKGLKNLRKALEHRENRAAHIAMMGDSYIEGDIITMELREQLQKKYGGRGVGYVAAHNPVQGFRTTVRHSDSGWNHHPIAEASKSNYFTVAGEYYTGSPGATISLQGIDKIEQLAAWNSTRLLFIAPSSGRVSITAADSTYNFDITGSKGVQSILLPTETNSVKIKSNISGLNMLGVWVEDMNGVVVDNMSIRGDSGVGRRNTNVSLARQMRDFVDYDLIIVEFGINALSSKQTDYSKYCNIMTDVLHRLKQCYPAADIILLGIGDRGQKIQGVPHSFPTAPYMVSAQRQAAKNAGVMFWDTREAMGGEDAIVRWRNDKLANGDFIHLNHAGGKRLGKALFNAIDASINEKK